MFLVVFLGCFDVFWRVSRFFTGFFYVSALSSGIPVGDLL